LPDGFGLTAFLSGFILGGVLVSDYSSIWETEKNGIVYAVFRLNGKTKWERIGEKRFLTRELINIKKKVILKKLINGEFIVKKIMFEKMIEEFLEFAKKYRTPRTFQTTIGHCKNLLKYFKGILISQIAPNFIEGYIDERKKQNSKLSNKTIINELFTLSAIFRQAVKKGYVTENPVKRVERPRYSAPDARAFTKREVDLVLANCSRYLKGILLVGLTTGFRKSEICNLRWEHVNFEEGIIKLTCDETFQTKNKKPRMAVIVPELSRELEFLRTNWIDPVKDTVIPRQLMQMNYVFCHFNGWRIQDFSNAFEKLMKRLSIEDATPHTMRRTFITFHATTDPLLTQKMIGHSNIRITEGYYDAQIDRMKLSMRPIEELISVN
jgi:integrase